MSKSNKILEVKNLYVSYGDLQVVRGVNLSLNKGEILGIVGESGSGKTTMLRSIMMLKQKGMSISGNIKFWDQDLTKLSKEKLRRLRGNEISMIPQNVVESMDPTKTISSLINETIKMHYGRISRRDSDEKAESIMKLLLLDNPRRILKSYPFELSGGMCQRVAIAVAMINNPKLILGDEPTSALDATSQLQVVEQLQVLKEEFNISLALISHNLRVISKISDKIAIMYGGKIIEYGLRDEIIKTPIHPYTKALIEAIPDLDGNISKGLGGIPPEFTEDIRGCSFAQRCCNCDIKCLQNVPKDIHVSDSHRVQCFKVKDDNQQMQGFVSKELA